MLSMITLTTDFGSGWGYVAQLKGVLHSLCPGHPVVDICHDLPAQSITTAEVLLRGAVWAFPVGTVHVVVVDPGVGTSRRPVAMAHRGMFFVGPDNGVLAGLAAGHGVEGARWVHLDRTHLFREPVSTTFHGRDIFAPVAAHLAAGLPLAEVGTAIDDPVPSNLPAAKQTAGADNCWQGEILAADSFGNLLTNIPGQGLEGIVKGPGKLNTPGQGLDLAMVDTYGHAGDTPVLLFGSDGYLEIALRNGSAERWLQERFGVTPVGWQLRVPCAA